MDFFQLSDNLSEQLGKYWVSPQCEGYPCVVGSAGFVAQVARCQHDSAIFGTFPLDFKAASTDTSNIIPPPLSPLVGVAQPRGGLFFGSTFSFHSMTPFGSFQ